MPLARGYPVHRRNGMTQNLVLLVDDDPVFTQFTQNILTEKGMKVMTAFNKA